ncbi:hypothetical protein BD310DRAFT_916336 [Dichomitus squalens]|uniref:RING-type domain-containing protein n=1 Tax=Dichomitus squalens TaxID=114155 RepID=A0A4Q9Q7D1_9APHY|nr:hypothetical protein BD310DRAFT_916336 [Dichomitus squalens]
MSSPVRVLGPVTPVSRGTNLQKRVLTDSEDIEERDTKRARSQETPGDQGTRQDAKEKKKRRKKRRKVSVVQANDSSDTEAPVVASQPELARVRSRSVVSTGLDAVVVTNSMKAVQTDTRQPSAGPSVSPGTTPKSPSRDCERRTPTRPASMEKGKARATPDPVITQNDQLEVNELQRQVSDKENLVSQHESLVSSLQQSLSCQICLDLMHRPYALSPCGHSACYQCLVNWFKTPPPDLPAHEVLPAFYRRKTCPHCRAVVTERPVEIWTMKEMVATLVKSGLATGFYNATPAQPEGTANADPWAGIFRRPAQQGRDAFPGLPFGLPMHEHQMMGMRDDEDDVFRCVECHYEIVDGMCANCGQEYPGHDPEHDASDYDSDEEGFPVWGANGPVGVAGGLGALLQHLFPQWQHHHPHDHGADYLIDNHPVGHDWDEGGDTEIELESDDEDFDPHADANQRAASRTVARLLGRIVGEEDTEDEEGYESSFIDDGDAELAPRAGSSRLGRAVDLDEDHAIDLSDGESQDGVDGLHDEDDEDEDDEAVRFVGFGRRRAHATRLPASDGEDHHDEDASDFSDSHDEEEEDNLADEVAARELELYGDDGSVPRRTGGGGYDTLDSDEDYY